MLKAGGSKQRVYGIEFFLQLFCKTETVSKLHYLKSYMKIY